MDRISNILSSVSTANLADAHDHLGLVCKWLTRELTPTKRNKFWGHADVVQWGPTRKSNDIRAASPSTWEEVGRFVDQISSVDKPRVYVSGCKDISDEYVLLGGISTTYLDVSGYTGAICYGAIRDYEDTMSLELPIWSSGFAVMDSQGCMKIESRGVSCTISGHTIFQDDYIIGDGNGVVAIAAEAFSDVLQKSQEISEIEDNVMKQVKAGENLFELVTKGGHI